MKKPMVGMAALLGTGCDHVTWVDGLVRDPLGRPVAGATVLLGLCAATTDRDGFFIIWFVHDPRYAEIDLTVARDGYAAWERRLAAGREHLLQVTLAPEPLADSA
jgi:hypothetical protein